MKVQITQTLVIEAHLVDSDDDGDFTIEQFRDSYVDTLLDSENVGFETSDMKFNYTPREIVGQVSIARVDD